MPREPRWALTAVGMEDARRRIEVGLRDFVMEVIGATKMRAMCWLQFVLRVRYGTYEIWLEAACGNAQAGRIPWRVHFHALTEQRFVMMASSN